MKYIIALCEGQHDISFISKILLTNSFNPHNKKISKFEKIISNLFTNIYKDKKIGDMKLGFNSDHLIPSVALISKDESKTVFIHKTNGDASVKERKEIVQQYISIMPQDEYNDEDDFDEESFSFTPDLDLRFLFFLDADDKTVDDRVKILNSEFDVEMKNAEVTNDNNIDWGVYIYHNGTDGNNTLENILLDMMISNNQYIFNNAKNYIDTTAHLLENRQYEYKSKDNTYNTSNKFKEKKSLISIAGQLQFSGMNNSVIIAKSDYIKKDDILNNNYCQAINRLF
jgi:hypothetical protein